MSTTSTHLSLVVPTTSDHFSTATLAANWGKIDAAPGLTICTSSTRPGSWGASQAGMFIIETNTGLIYRWDGSGWLRQNGKGWLNGTTRTSDFSTVSTTLQTVVSTVAVVPAGARRIRVTATWKLAEGTTGRIAMALLRDSTQLQGWEARGLVGGDAQTNGIGSSMTAWDDPGAGGGSPTYALKIAATTTYAGTAWLRATATAPITIDVEEC